MRPKPPILHPSSYPQHMVRGVHIRFIPPAHRWFVLGLDLAGVVDQQIATPGAFASVRSIQARARRGAPLGGYW